MTDYETGVLILLSAIFTVLFFIATSMPNDKKTTKLLEQIRGNTMDKTKPVKLVDVTTNKTKVTKFAYCPVCGKFISSGFKRCDNCGAEIDWSDIE